MSATSHAPGEHDADPHEGSDETGRDGAARGTGTASAGADFSKVRGSAEHGHDTAPPADFSKVRGSVESTGEAAGERAHTVVAGDNLSGISRQYYGDARHWRALFDANRDQLDDPDLIQPGQVLRIPARDDG
jgi:nucleoid-associated protein YgaU